MSNIESKEKTIKNEERKLFECSRNLNNCKVKIDFLRDTLKDLELNYEEIQKNYMNIFCSIQYTQTELIQILKENKGGEQS
jgi:hypothetical protein